MKSLETHLSHPFYREAAEFWAKVRAQQIMKGAQKYVEPFTTSSWTDAEIINHAMQENVDQAHYIYAAKERMEEQRKQLDELTFLCEEQVELSIHQAKRIRQLEEQLQRTKENEG
ncbi:hypothetical protein [Salipaludibacillus aurantiacus]|uniref:Uncharacterized protein n=1 Tax=Salipaludibacillus aurantiacus TaxID=1601833 RepID=A0A1H9U0Y5_9BACI|nr:hypothetical protein [Salipaludibacillus aurantiacus]SES03029.1 hypothetical protein SAMN05518684_106221 [Salipaludibacillus aurantiacus]